MPSPFNLLLSLFIFWLFSKLRVAVGDPVLPSIRGFCSSRSRGTRCTDQSPPQLRCWRVFYSLKTRLSPAAQTRHRCVPRSLAIVAPRSNILLGFVFPVQTRQVVYFVLGIELLFGLMTGMATISVTLGGIAMGHYSTGKWRPSAWNLPKRSKTKRRPSHLRLSKTTNRRCIEEAVMSRSSGRKRILDVERYAPRRHGIPQARRVPGPGLEHHGALLTPIHQGH